MRLGPLLLALLASAGAALAAEPAPATEPRVDQGLVLSFRGVGEVWQDPAIAAHYRSSRFAGAGFAGWFFLPSLGATLEAGYMRQDAAADRGGVSPGSLELIPLTLGVQWRRVGEAADVFAGGGAAFAVFNESTAARVTSGTKPGLDLNAGVRIHTNLLQPSMRPSGSPGVRGLDVELFAGRRQHHAFGLGSGFDLGAWRVGAGLAVRL